MKKVKSTFKGKKSKGMPIDRSAYFSPKKPKVPANNTFNGTGK